MDMNTLVTNGADGFADDSSSTLSSRSVTPSPPPSTPQITTPIVIAPVTTRPVVECKHFSWCECPVRTAEGSGLRFRHLGVHALSHMQFPSSDDRHTSKPLPITEASKERLRKAAVFEKYVVDGLPGIAAGNTTTLASPSDARQLVTELNLVFDPANEELDEELGMPIIEQLVVAIKQWKRDCDYDKLELKFSSMVRGRKGLRYGFQKFLPDRLRMLKIEEVRAEQGKSVEPDLVEYWDMVDQLERDRSRIGG